jgi:hypothetical protein
MPRPQASTMNITLYPVHRKTLDELGEVMSCSAAQVIRTLVLAARAHTLHNSPTCANGNPCLVPQMHPPTPSAQPDPRREAAA